MDGDFLLRPKVANNLSDDGGVGSQYRGHSVRELEPSHRHSSVREKQPHGDRSLRGRSLNIHVNLLVVAFSIGGEQFTGRTGLPQVLTLVKGWITMELCHVPR